MSAEQPIFNEFGIGDLTNRHIIGSLQKGHDEPVLLEMNLLRYIQLRFAKNLLQFLLVE